MRSLLRPARAPSFVALALAVLAFTAPRPSSAQVQFGLSGGLNVPREDAGVSLVRGWTGEASLWLTSPGRPLGARVQGGYSRWGYSDDARGYSESIDMGSYDALHATADAVLALGADSRAPIRPYLVGGVGVYRLHVQSSAPIAGVVIYNGPVGGEDPSAVKFGLNGGGGVMWTMPHVSFYAEATYHHLFSGSDSVGMIPITLGIRWGS